MRRGMWCRSVWQGVAAAVAAAVLAGPAMGQAFNPYYDKLPEPAAAEAKQWAELYWSRVDAGGTPDAAAPAFTFADAGMNGHFFNPLRAVRPTLEKLNVIDAGLCDGMKYFGVPWPEEIEAQRAEIRKAMLDGKIETSFTSNSAGSVQHWVLILAAVSDPDLEVSFEGDNLVSTNLPLEQVSAEGYQAAMAMGLSQSTQDMIATCIQSSAGWAAWATASGVPEWQALITGEMSTAEAFAMAVRQQLELEQVEPTFVDVATANFGIHGEFAFVVVRVPDAVMLLDPLTGTLAGPFDPQSPVDATGLLAAHSSIYIPGSDVKHYDSSGCSPPVAIWVPGLPPIPTGPRIPMPAVPPAFPLPGWTLPTPAYPTPPPFNPTVLGWTNCICAVTPLTSTTLCTEVSQEVGGGRIWQIIKYYNCNLMPVGAVPCPIGGACTLVAQETWH